MTIKATQYRDDANFMNLAMSKAKELGVSFNQVMKQAMRQWLGLPEQPKEETILKGTAADVVIADGVCYNWTGKRRINTMLPVHLVSHGKLWLVDRTKNYSHKIIHSVCVLPQCLLSKVGDSRWDYVPKLLEMVSDDLIDTVANLLQVEVTDWFQTMHPRQQEHVIEAAINGDTLEDLLQHYAPVITEPETVEETQSNVITPEKAKATQLQQRYNISADEWHRNVGTWKRQCLRTIDGLVWLCNNKGVWQTQVIG